MNTSDTARKLDELKETLEGHLPQLNHLRVLAAERAEQYRALKALKAELSTAIQDQLSRTQKLLAVVRGHQHTVAAANVEPESNSNEVNMIEEDNVIKSEGHAQQGHRASELSEMFRTISSEATATASSHIQQKHPPPTPHSTCTYGVYDLHTCFSSADVMETNPSTRTFPTIAADRQLSQKSNSSHLNGVSFNSNSSNWGSSSTALNLDWPNTEVIGNTHDWTANTTNLSSLGFSPQVTVHRSSTPLAVPIPGPGRPGEQPHPHSYSQGTTRHSGKCGNSGMEYAPPRTLKRSTTQPECIPEHARPFLGGMLGFSAPTWHEESWMRGHSGKSTSKHACSERHDIGSCLDTTMATLEHLLSEDLENPTQISQFEYRSRRPRQPEPSLPQSEHPIHSNYVPALARMGHHNDFRKPPVCMKSLGYVLGGGADYKDQKFKMEETYGQTPAPQRSLLQQSSMHELSAPMGHGRLAYRRCISTPAYGTLGPGSTPPPSMSVGADLMDSGCFNEIMRSIDEGKDFMTLQ